MNNLTKEQAIIVSGYTGFLICDFGDLHQDIESRLGRSVFNYELTHLNMKDIYKKDFIAMKPKENEMESQLPTASSETEMPEVKLIKPIYTKEMHDRGELPPVGSYFAMNNTPEHFHFSKFNGLPCEVLALTKYEDGVVVTFNNEKEGFSAECF